MADNEAPPKRARTTGPRSSKPKDAAPPPPVNPNNPLMPMFLSFREDLDEHHDRRERIIKTSRDVTALSKKMIFSMQRTRKLASPLPDHISKDIAQKQSQIDTFLTNIASDLTSLNAHRYAPQISGGLQELIEALCFQHYLTTGALLPYALAQSKTAPINLPVSDYILGVYDFVGEVMRFGITMIALGGGGGTNEGDAQRILKDLRALRAEFEGLDTGGNTFLARDCWKKMGVMKTCVEKVENAVGQYVVRGAEMPKGWMPDFSERREAVGEREFDE